jgi:hypothetical protein
MSNKSDPSQGAVKSSQPRGHKVPQPDGKAIIRGMQRGLDAADQKLTTPKAPQKVSGKQDWRKG